MFRLSSLAILGIAFSFTAIADDGWGEHHHRHHHHHHHHHHRYQRDYYPAYPVERVYVPAPVVQYVPAPPVYYAPPPPPVRYGYYDQRNPSGLVGGVVGSALGYEMGRGDPLAAGIGAAAGSWLGNGMNR